MKSLNLSFHSIQLRPSWTLEAKNCNHLPRSMPNRGENTTARSSLKDSRSTEMLEYYTNHRLANFKSSRKVDNFAFQLLSLSHNTIWPGPVPVHPWHPGKLAVHKPMPENNRRCTQSSMARPNPDPSDPSDPGPEDLISDLIFLNARLTLRV